MKFRIRTVVPMVLGALVALALAACSSAGPAGTSTSGTSAAPATTNVRYIYNNTAPIPVYAVAQAEGLFAKNGVKVAEADLSDPGAATTALLANQADMADVPIATAMLAIQKGGPIKIIAGQSYGFSDAETGDSYQAAVLAAPNSTGIKSLADLKGKKVAVASLGSSYYFELLGDLQNIGLTKADVNIVPVPYTGMVAALAEHEVDAAIMISTNFAQLDKATPSTIVMTGSALLGTKIEEPSVLAVRDDFAKAHPDAVAGFLAGLISAEDWIQKDLTTNNGANAKAVLQKATGYPDAAMTSYMQLRVDGVGKESEYTNLLSVPQAVVDAQTKLLHSSGQLAASVNLTSADVVDNAPLKAALQKLGKQWQNNPPLPD